MLTTSTATRRPRTWIGRVDPRLRILAAVGVSVVVAVADRLPVLGAALGAAVVAFAFSGLPPRTALRRLVPLNVLLFLVAAVLPFTTPGKTAWHLGPLAASHQGLLLAAAIWLKGNAVLLALVALFGSMDASTFGHAMSHLRVPDKLTHLLLFTVRYLDVLHRESLRLRAAMKVRAFRPGMNRHTYRAYGHLVGMLLVRSFDRAERIVAAMKCRGFRGRFYLLDHFHYSWADLPFAVLSLAILGGLLWAGWR
jgi:cobalt/nickel transport system permease protein